ncbi:hypothetical protein P4N68_00015 [Corynebacterium felinum]|uniref:Deoxyribose-phosphate aldolase n=1 Tax=Corynebacterium felinum TaxID=131318 RepID=A0ABU2B8C9_9CORY|nr:hypothetical protein [Corynebacterium felinum]MDF5819469.1 hypothetical protein [Corynebacterium felinum]MDR7354521.1 deoxyribose-phosphate aldolase [Corynebacterium felinum]WJY93888.1 deoxyribose-phosphate aldolase [Corynebacterium felinum]
MKIYSTALGRCVDAQQVRALSTPVCVPANWVEVAGFGCATVVGFPTGQHHALVKASEARLAVSQGAELVVVVPAPHAVLGDDHALMLELVTIREAVAYPTTLVVVFDAELIDVDRMRSCARLARTCGVDALMSSVSESDPASDAILAEELPVVGIGMEKPERAVVWLRTGL